MIFLLSREIFYKPCVQLQLRCTYLDIYYVGIIVIVLWLTFVISIVMYYKYVLLCIL